MIDPSFKRSGSHLDGITAHFSSWVLVLDEGSRTVTLERADKKNHDAAQQPFAYTACAHSETNGDWKRAARMKLEAGSRGIPNHLRFVDGFPIPGGASGGRMDDVEGQVCEVPHFSARLVYRQPNAANTSGPSSEHPYEDRRAVLMLVADRLHETPTQPRGQQSTNPHYVLTKFSFCSGVRGRDGVASGSLVVRLARAKFIRELAASVSQLKPNCAQRPLRESQARQIPWAGWKAHAPLPPPPTR